MGARLHFEMRTTNEFIPLVRLSKRSTNKCDEYEGMMMVFRERGSRLECTGAIVAREFSKV